MKDPLLQLLSETNQALREIRQTLREGNERQRDLNAHLKEAANNLADLRIAVYRVRDHVSYIGCVMWIVFLIGAYVIYTGIKP